MYMGEMETSLRNGVYPVVGSTDWAMFGKRGGSELGGYWADLGALSVDIRAMQPS